MRERVIRQRDAGVCADQDYSQTSLERMVEEGLR